MQWADMNTTLVPTQVPTTSNESGNTTVHYDIGQETWLRVTFIVIYSLIFIVGFSGNILVVYVVVRNKSMHTITNIFITNLAVSDIMMCLLAVPFTPLSAFMDSWVFGEALCHIVPMTLGVSVYVSTLTSTAIAIDRYFVIVHPFKPRMKIFVCLLLIVAIWIISVSISLPLAIYQKLVWEEGLQGYSCFEYWPKATARQFYTVTNLILQYIVPCSIITFCYTKVSWVLKARAKAKAGMCNKSRERDEMEIRRKRRTNNMLIAMVTIFVVCWLPLNVILITLEYRKGLQDWMYFVVIFFVAHSIAMSSTIYNPFLYGWMNDNFLKEFKKVLPSCLFGGRRHQSVNGNTAATQYTTVATDATVLRRGTARLSPDAPGAAAGGGGHDNGSVMYNNAQTTSSSAMYNAESEKVHLQAAADPMDD